MNDYLATLPFDLYELNLFQLIAESKSFTKAARQAGLTQSAITRQIKGVEESLGLALFERTTRYVALTPAGELLMSKSVRILSEVNASVEELRQAFDLAPKTIRIGISRTIGLAYLPGFFVQFRRKFPDIQIQVVHQKSQEILSGVEDRSLDVGLLCPPPKLSRGLTATHAFQDDFTFIAPGSMRLGSKIRLRDINQMRLLSVDRESNTGRLLDKWLKRQGITAGPTMEMDNFDLLVNLVGMGLGVGFVPNRALPLYFNRRAVQKVPLAVKFSRRLIVVVRKSPAQPKLIRDFVENVLF